MSPIFIINTLIYRPLDQKVPWPTLLGYINKATFTSINKPVVLTWDFSSSCVIRMPIPITYWTQVLSKYIHHVGCPVRLMMLQLKTCLVFHRMDMPCSVPIPPNSCLVCTCYTIWLRLTAPNKLLAVVVQMAPKCCWHAGVGSGHHSTASDGNSQTLTSTGFAFATCPAGQFRGAQAIIPCIIMCMSFLCCWFTKNKTYGIPSCVFLHNTVHEVVDAPSKVTRSFSHTASISLDSQLVFIFFAIFAEHLSVVEVLSNWTSESWMLSSHVTIPHMTATPTLTNIVRQVGPVCVESSVFEERYRPSDLRSLVNQGITIHQQNFPSYVNAAAAAEKQNMSNVGVGSEQERKLSRILSTYTITNCFSKLIAQHWMQPGVAKARLSFQNQKFKHAVIELWIWHRGSCWHVFDHETVCWRSPEMLVEGCIKFVPIFNLSPYQCILACIALFSQACILSNFHEVLKLTVKFPCLQGLNQLQHAFHWATCYLHDEVVPVTIDICERLPFLKAVMADLTRTYLQQTENQLLRDQKAAILKTAYKHAHASVASTSKSHNQSSKTHHSRAS